MSSFFEPLPPPPPDVPRAWRAPAWDRPSEGTLPAILPVGELVGRNDEVVVAIEHLGVYPNGFTVHLKMLTNPNQGVPVDGRMLVAGGSGMLGHPMSRFPRIGIRFADGRSAGREADAGIVRPGDVDADGFPVDPVIRMVGGGGGSGGYSFSAWVFPLPPDGPLEIFVSTAGLGADEASVVIDGATVRAAAGRAKVIWS